MRRLAPSDDSNRASLAEITRGQLWRWVQWRRRTHLWGTEPGLYDPALIEKTLGWLTRFARPGGGLFPIEARGLGRLPPAPVMLVSNHSGGTMVIDAWGL